MSQSVWSPLSDLRPKICGKVENNKVYCECGAEAREFTVRKDGPTQGRQFLKCGNNDACKLWLWKDHADQYDNKGQRTHNSSAPAPESSSPSTMKPSGRPAGAAARPSNRNQSGVKGRSTVLPTPSPSPSAAAGSSSLKRKSQQPVQNRSASLSDTDDEPSSDEEYMRELQASPTKKGKPSAPPPSKININNNSKTSYRSSEDVEDWPPSPTETPRKQQQQSLASFGQQSQTQSTPTSRATPASASASATTSAAKSTPLTEALDRFELDVQDVVKQQASPLRKECEKQGRLLMAANLKIANKEKQVKSAQDEVASLKARIRLLEEENAALRSS